jgi:hypothetical protein
MFSYVFTVIMIQLYLCCAGFLIILDEDDDDDEDDEEDDDDEDDEDDEEEEEEHLYMTEDEDDLFQDLLEHPHTTESALHLDTGNIAFQSTTRSATPPAPVEDRSGTTSATHRYVTVLCVRH